MLTVLAAYCSGKVNGTEQVSTLPSVSLMVMVNVWLFISGTDVNLSDEPGVLHRRNKFSWVSSDTGMTIG